MIVLETPTRARLVSPTLDGTNYEEVRSSLEAALTYTDKRVEFELKKTTNTIRRWEGGARSGLIASMGKDLFETRLEELKLKQAELKKARKKCLLFEDARGLWTYSGLAYSLAKKYQDEVEVLYQLPEPRELAWDKPPQHADRPYQSLAHDLLLQAAPHGPCAVELATGAGKSRIIMNLVKTLGLGTLIMAPSTSIAHQLYDDLVEAFGKRYVGLYGDGKKQYDKLVVVGIDDSLTRIKPDDEAWAAIRSKPVFIADESHLCPADTLAKVCFNLAAKATYRFFFSATQLRNDGLDLVLDGITGRIVMHKNVRELVDEGYLAKPIFKMVKVKTNSTYSSDDAIRMTRKHLYYNRQVYERAADLANKFVEHAKRPVLILVEEIEQLEPLAKQLKFPYMFAHGLTKSDAKKRIDCNDEYPCSGDTGIKCRHHDGSGNQAIVNAFNAGAFPILIGTSCIATGTDIRAVEAAIYLQGGKSEIKIKQAVGRETRGGSKGFVFNLATGKQKLNCIHVDFDVVDPDMDPKELEGFAPHRHALERVKIYNDIYGPVEYV